MRKLLMGIVALSFLEMIVLLFADREQMRITVKMIGSVAMATFLIGQFVSLDYSDYSAAIRKQSLSEAPDFEKTQEDARRMDRLLIEEECAAYILDIAEEMGISLRGVSVTLAWSTEGFWYPASAEILIPAGESRADALSDQIQTDLGISRDNQYWKEDERTVELG